MTEWGYIFIGVFSASMLALVVFLADRLKRARISRQRDNIREKEQRIYKLYQRLEDMIDGAEEYLEEVKQEIAEEREKALALLKLAQETAQGALTPETPAPETPVLKMPTRQKPATAGNAANAAAQAETRDSTQGQTPAAPQEMPAVAPPRKQREAISRAEAPVDSGAPQTQRPAVVSGSAAPHLSGAQKGRQEGVLPRAQKIENVRRLHQSGKKGEEIAKELGLSYGEVNLILGMP
ncbi:MAG: hypothetical protein LBS18_04020 [Clostridiales bacterium]|jgi:hypothetical protein|nr:hypothetical protein [Clostridiales bacterium]